MKRRGFLGALLGLPVAAKGLADVPKVEPVPEPVVEEKIAFNETLVWSEEFCCTIVSYGAFGNFDRCEYIPAPYRNK